MNADDEDQGTKLGNMNSTSGVLGFDRRISALIRGENQFFLNVLKAQRIR